MVENSFSIVEDAQNSSIKDPLKITLDNIPKSDELKTFTQGFVIATDNKIEDLSSEFLTAYEVINPEGQQGEYYALILNKLAPLPFSYISQLLKAPIDCLQCPVHASFIKLSDNDEEFSLSLLMPKTKGENLITYMQGNRKLTQAMQNKLVKNLANILLKLHVAGITYGALNPKNIFIKEDGKLELKECISSPLSFQQDQRYETIIKAQCSPFGKLDPSKRDDYYALGCVAFDIFSNLALYSFKSNQELLEQKIQHGSYEALRMLFSVYGNVNDLINGLVADDPQKSWGDNEINRFYNGEKYNVPPKYSTNIVKPIVFNGQEYKMVETLVYAMSNKWEDAKSFVETDRFKRWLASLDIGYVPGDIIESVNYITRYKLPVASSVCKSDLNLTKLFTILAPKWPMKIKECTFEVKAAPKALAYSYVFNKSITTNTLISFYLSDIDAVFSKLSHYLDNELKRTAQWVKKARNTIIDNNFGFGLEKCIYDFNPTLPLISKNLPINRCFDIETVLENLEKNELSAQSIIDDRHISAFLSSKLSLTKPLELKKHKGTEIGDMKEIKAISLLAMAQHRSSVGKLPNLATKVSGLLKNSIEKIIRSATYRKELIKKLEAECENGSLYKILRLVTDPKLIKNDRQGLEAAKKKYGNLRRKISYYSNIKNIENLEYEKGLKIAVNIGYIACYVTILFSIMKYI